MTVIATAAARDAEAIGAVHLRSALTAYADIFPRSTPPPTSEQLTAQWQAMIGDPGARVLVARGDGAIVGAVALEAAPTVPSGLLLVGLYVDPDHWGRGIGSMLHDAAVADARLRSDGLNLWVLEANLVARAMYERRGWSLVPDRHLANEPPEIRDVLYQLDLTGC